MKRQLIGGLLAAMLLVGVLAVPAIAKNDAGTFEGTATVGAGFAAADPCDNSGKATVVGKGLYVPTLNDHNAVYQLSSSATSVINGVGDFDVCGYLTSVAGIGAACGWSKGYGGQGKASWPSKPGVEVSLEEIEWKLAPGGIIPVTGKVTEVSAGTKTSTGKAVGTLFALVVVAVDDAECADSKPDPGENDIVVLTGVYVIKQYAKWYDQNRFTDYIDPKDDGPSGPTNPWGDKK